MKMLVQNLAQFFSRFKYIRGFAVIDVVIFVMNCCHRWFQSLILFGVRFFLLPNHIHSIFTGIFKHKNLPEI